MSKQVPADFKPSPLGKIPKSWNIMRIGELGTVVTGGTPPTKDDDNYGSQYMFVTPADMLTSKYISSTSKMLSAKGMAFNRSIPANAIMVVCIASLGKIAMSSEECTTNQQINSIICKNTYHPDFFFYYLQSNPNLLTSIAGKTAVPIVNKTLFSDIEIPVPPLPEQRKIAAVLSSADRSIAATEKLIAKLADLKKALMQQLLTKGIGHTEFKPSPLGPIPKSWEVVKIKAVLELAENRKIELDDNLLYHLVTVKRRHGGVTEREILLGKNILVKNQYLLQKGDFLISKRQIVHGACEIVPKELDGSVVSNEYNIFLARPKLYLDYFRWLSQTRMMLDYFFNNSVGVHIEKMLFKTDSWLEECIPLPSLEEQQKIAGTISATHIKMKNAERKLEKLKDLKQGLMNDLLTGKVRVKA